MTTDKKTWLITGAGRGTGVDIAKPALAAGHNVVATGRNPDAVAEALGDANELLAVKLDVTSVQDAEAAVEAAVVRFGGIDVLINNAASFYAGFFEELTPEQMQRQLVVGLIGPMNVTRAVLPGHARAALGTCGDDLVVGSVRGPRVLQRLRRIEVRHRRLDGIARPEVAPLGIHTTVVNPGFFRTKLLTKESTSYAEPSIADYAERSAAQREFWEGMNGQQAATRPSSPRPC
jgi:NAD(P)-dependent dehydrogenase (short-subunit alcohol dehydrogenase family)